MSFFSKLWNSIFARKLGDDIQQELETHLDLLEEEHRARGLNENDALREARRRFGNPSRHFEGTRDVNLSNWLNDFTQDMRFAFRQLRKNAGFTVVAVLVIALGISAVTTVFSLVDAVLIRALPYGDPPAWFICGRPIPAWVRLFRASLRLVFRISTIGSVSAIPSRRWQW